MTAAKLSAASAGDCAQHADPGQEKQHGHGKTMDPDELPHQLHAPHERRLLARMLDRMRHLVRRDRDGGNGAAVVMLRQQPDGAIGGVVMVALVGGLDLDVGQLEFVEQMPRQFAAGAGQVRPVAAVLGHDVLHPPLWAEHNGEKQQDTDGSKNGHVRIIAELVTTTKPCRLRTARLP